MATFSLIIRGRGIKMFINNLAKASLIALSLSASVFSTDSLYAGVSMGETSSHFSLDRDLAIGRKDSSNIGKDSFNYGLFVGYNYLIKESPIFIGVEIGAQNHNLEATKGESTFPPFVNYVTKIRTNNSLSGVFKLGIVVKDLMIYGKGGIVRTNWMMNFVDKGNFRADSAISQKFTKDGSLFGFGVDYSLNPKWSIGVDYTVANYPNLKLVHRLGEFKMNPSLRTTTFRLSYAF